jgi:hypothetical protein
MSQLWTVSNGRQIVPRDVNSNSPTGAQAVDIGGWEVNAAVDAAQATLKCCFRKAVERT